MKKKSLTLPMLIALLGVLMMIVSVFLPYITADKREAAYIFGEGVDSVTMISFAEICLDSILFAGIGITLYVLVGMLGLFALLALLFVLLKKPIPAIVFTVLSASSFFLYGSMFNLERTDCSLGMAYYIYLIAAVVAVFGSIWLKVAKVKAKKQTV